MQKYLIALTFLLCGFIYGQTAEAPSNFTEPGAGTADNPYQISSLENLYWIQQNSNQWDKHYEQTANIDASSTAGHAWISIGDERTSSFTGVYDGKGFTVNNLFISDQSPGMFGETNGSVIKNLGVTNVNINAPFRIGVGGLVGVDKGTITNCYTTGNVSGSGNVGGLVGDGGSTITHCYSTCSVSGESGVGGLVGANRGSVISFSYSSGNVNSKSGYAGGLVGYDRENGVNNQNGTISCCYATGNVNGSSGDDMGSFAGGLVGATSSTISNCYSRCDSVTGSEFVGGLIGFYGNMNVKPKVTNCYSTGRVTGIYKTGGLIGDYLNIEVHQCYWNSTDNPSGDNGAGTGRSSNYMKGFSLYLQSNWSTDIWVLNPGFNYNLNKGFPYLVWQEMLGLPLSVEQDAEKDKVLPEEYALIQNFPNPFNPDTKIEFHLPAASIVTLKIYDILGNEIAVLADDEKPAGRHVSYWNGRNNYGQAAASGVYLYRITAGNFTETRKMNLLK